MLGIFKAGLSFLGSIFGGGSSKRAREQRRYLREQAANAKSDLGRQYDRINASLSVYNAPGTTAFADNYTDLQSKYRQIDSQLAYQESQLKGPSGIASFFSNFLLPGLKFGLTLFDYSKLASEAMNIGKLNEVADIISNLTLGNNSNLRANGVNGLAGGMQTPEGAAKPGTINQGTASGMSSGSTSDDRRRLGYDGVDRDWFSLVNTGRILSRDMGLV